MCRVGPCVSFAGQKIIFVLWSPDVAPVKPRMIYSSSKEALCKKLDGIHAQALEAHDMADLDSLH